MAKHLLAVVVVATCLVVTGPPPASAHVDFSIGIGIPGLYVGPPAYYPPPPVYYYEPPVYYSPYYAPYPGSTLYFGRRFGPHGHRWNGGRPHRGYGGRPRRGHWR
jgi:hypothetical protein